MAKKVPKEPAIEVQKAGRNRLLEGDVVVHGAGVEVAVAANFAATFAASIRLVGSAVPWPAMS